MLCCFGGLREVAEKFRALESCGELWRARHSNPNAESVANSGRGAAVVCAEERSCVVVHSDMRARENECSFGPTTAVALFLP